MGFESSWDSAHGMRTLELRLQENGHTMTLRTEADAVGLGLNHGYIRPIVDKPDVIEMVERGKLFPHEINRHLVEGRPLNLCVPVEASLDESQFKEHLDHACHTTPLAVGPGARDGERLYEEPITLFRRHRHHT